MRKIKNKRHKPKPFLEEWEGGDKLVETDVCEHDGVEEEQSLDAREGKEMKTLFETSIEKESSCATHVIFMIETSCVQVARSSRQNT